MADRRRVVAAIKKYNRLTARLEEDRQEQPSAGLIKDKSGSFIDGSVHASIIDHLIESLALDEDDDAIRLLLAFEYWRVDDRPRAIAEYKRILSRDSIQSLVAQRMLDDMDRSAT